MAPVDICSSSVNAGTAKQDLNWVQVRSGGDFVGTAVNGAFINGSGNRNLGKTGHGDLGMRRPDQRTWMGHMLTTGTFKFGTAGGAYSKP